MPLAQWQNNGNGWPISHGGNISSTFWKYNQPWYTECCDRNINNIWWRVRIQWSNVQNPRNYPSRKNMSCVNAPSALLHPMVWTWMNLVWNGIPTAPKYSDRYTPRFTMFKWRSETTRRMDAIKGWSGAPNNRNENPRALFETLFSTNLHLKLGPGLWLGGL